MHGRLLFLCLAAVPWVAHGAAECHGRRFGDTTQRFNEAWATGKWGGVARFDSQGQLLPEPPQPPPVDAITTIVLKDGETTRTLGQYYYPQASNADGKLQTAIVDAVNAATTHE